MVLAPPPADSATNSGGAVSVYIQDVVAHDIFIVVAHELAAVLPRGEWLSDFMVIYMVT